MKKLTDKEIIKDLKLKLSHAEKSRDDNYGRYVDEYNKVKSTEVKLKEAQEEYRRIADVRGELDNRELHRLTEIIRWLINKDTAIPKEIPPFNRNY